MFDDLLIYVNVCSVSDNDIVPAEPCFAVPFVAMLNSIIDIILHFSHQLDS